MAKRGPKRHPTLLTPRETEVLALIRDGLTNAQIADRLNISPETAKYHVSEILSKLNVPTREAAAAWQPAARPFSLGRALIAAASLTTLAAVVAGLALLSWGLSRSGTGTEADSGRAATAPTGVARIAFIADTGNASDIWTVNSDGTDLQLFVDLEASENPAELRWSDDGSKLTFLVRDDSVPTHPTSWRYSADLDGNWTREHPLEIPPVGIVVMDDYEFRDGPDGTPPRSEQLIGHTVLRSPATGAMAVYVGLQSWNGPGSSSGNADTTSVWLLDENGKNPRKLTDEFGYSSPTDWSYDGQRLAFNCAPEFWQGEPVSVPPGIEAEFPMGVCVANRDASKIQRVADGCNAIWTAGDRLIFAGNGSLRSIGANGEDEFIIVEYEGPYDHFAAYQSGEASNSPFAVTTFC